MVLPFAEQTIAAKSHDYDRSHTLKRVLRMRDSEDIRSDAGPTDIQRPGPCAVDFALGTD